MFQILNYLLRKNCNLPEKENGYPFFSQQPPSKNWDPVKPSFWKLGRRLKPQPPSPFPPRAAEGERSHYALEGTLKYFKYILN